MLGTQGLLGINLNGEFTGLTYLVFNLNIEITGPTWYSTIMVRSQDLLDIQP